MAEGFGESHRCGFRPCRWGNGFGPEVLAVILRLIPCISCDHGVEIQYHHSHLLHTLSSIRVQGLTYDDTSQDFECYPFSVERPHDFERASVRWHIIIHNGRTSTDSIRSRDAEHSQNSSPPEFMLS